MYSTGENRVWTAKDEREMKEDHRRATRATRKHLGNLQTSAGIPGTTLEQQTDRTLLDKLLRRRTTEPPSADLPVEKRPLPPAAKQEPENRWWTRERTSTDRSHRPSASQDYQPLPSADPRMVTVTTNGRAPPPVPPRYDLMYTYQPPHPARERIRRKSEHDAAARRRARETALRHLETDHDIRRHVVIDKPGVAPAELAPGTWLPGQLNPVHFDREPTSAHYADEPEVATTQLSDFPTPPRALPIRRAPPTGPLPAPPALPIHLPPTQPLNIDAARRRNKETHNIPIPPIPATPQSNRDSFLELRRKRSCRV